MTSRFEALRSRVAAADTPREEQEEALPSDDEETPAEPAGKAKKKEPDMAEDNQAPEASVDTNSPSYRAGIEAGVAQERARFAAVTGSEHFAGREAAACDLLATSATAEQITGLLAKQPKVDTAAAAEEAGRTEMRAALDENRNPDLDSDVETPSATAAQKADSVWDYASKANARLNG